MCIRDSYLTKDQASALVSSGKEVKVAVGVYPGVPSPSVSPAPVSKKTGKVFKDCADCPEMVVIPAGSFRMGDLNGGLQKDEKPVHRVTIPRSFAVGKYEVTFAEWDRCVAAGGCSHRPRDEGWGRGNRPVINVSWNDTQTYIRWLSRKTGHKYRLLSEAEWEYVARAGSTTKYPWGNSVGRNQANCRSCGSSWDGKQTSPVGSFSANRFGLYDTIGNVWEWVSDCSIEGYAGAPSNGSSWTSGNCTSRVVRGGSWTTFPGSVRSANRGSSESGLRGSTSGFRLARTL